MERFKGISFLGLMVLYGCGGNSPDQIDQKSNVAPTILVSEQSQIIARGQTEVELTASAEDDKGIKTVIWKQVSGVEVVLNQADTLSASFVVPTVTYGQGEQHLSFTLTVTDVDNLESQAQVAVTLEPNNYTPTLAVIGPQKVVSGEEVTIVSEVADKDGDTISVTWEQNSGTAVAFIDNVQRISFVAPNTDEQQQLSFTATAVDDKGSAITESFSLSLTPKAPNTAPIISLENASQIIEPEQSVVNLNAVVTDDNGIKSILWEQVSGKGVALEKADTMNASFLVPVITDLEGDQSFVFSIIAIDTDNVETQAEASVTIKINNHLPLLSIEAPSEAYIGDVVLLEAKASDKDGQINAVIWEQVSGFELTSTQVNHNIAFDVPVITQQEEVRFKAIALDDKESSVSEEVSVILHPTERLLVFNEPEVITHAGVLTLVEWQVNQDVEMLDISIEQKSGPEVALTQYPQDNAVTFIAPENISQTTEIEFELKVQDGFGQVVTNNIEVAVEPIQTAFAERRKIFEFMTDPVVIQESTFVNVDTDEHADLVVQQTNNGVFWYRNLGAGLDGLDDFDKTPRFIREITTEWSDVPFIDFIDLNKNGLSDLVTVGNDGRYGALDIYYNLGEEFSEKQTVAVLPTVAFDNNKITIKSFSNQNNTYLIVSSDIHLLIYKVLGAGSGVEIASELSFPHPILGSSLEVCSVAQNKPGIFFRTLEKKAGPVDTLSHLYFLSSLDFEKPELLQSNQLSRGEGTCINTDGQSSVYIDNLSIRSLDSSKIQAVEFLDGEFIINDISDKFDLDSYIGRPSLTKYIQKFSSVDINQDGYDDMVEHDSLGSAIRVHTRIIAPDIEFDVTNLPDWCMSTDCKLSNVSSDKALIHTESINSIEFASLLDPLKTETISFPDEGETILNLSLFGNQLKVRTINSSDEKQFNYLTNYYADQLSFKSDLPLNSLPYITGPYDTVFNIAEAPQKQESLVFFNYDINQDGNLDVFSAFDMPYEGMPNELDGIIDNLQSFIATENSFLKSSLFSEIGKNTNYDLEPYRIAYMEDINSDGQVDFLLYRSGWEYSFYYDWFIYDDELSDWTIDKSIPSNAGHAVDKTALYTQFIDIDDNGLKDAISYTRHDDYYTCCWMDYPPDAFDGFRVGYLSVNKQSEMNVFDDAYIVDPQLKAFTDSSKFDVNQDGQLDILIQYYNVVKTEQAYKVDTTQLHTSWYEKSEQGEFQEVSMPGVWEAINFFDATKSGYFTELDFTNGKLYEYDYFKLLNTPVISRIINTNVIKGDEILGHLFYDIDKDGDLDILLYDKRSIYLHENNGLLSYN